MSTRNINVWKLRLLFLFSKVRCSIWNNRFPHGERETQTLHLHSSMVPLQLKTYHLKVLCCLNLYQLVF